MDKKPLIILTGPTAVGKTEISIQLAKAVNGEIISADSMQVYRNMNIGTAKIKPEEMNGVTHHLIDVLDPVEDFNVVLFQRLAKQAMQGIYNRGRIPIVVGGTGFYIQALLYDIEFDENHIENQMSGKHICNTANMISGIDKSIAGSVADVRARNADKKDKNHSTSYRAELTRYYVENGAAKLHELLKEIDPASYNTIHENNVKRVIRALEFYKENGYPISEHNTSQRKKESPYHFAYFVLNQNRSILYNRIEKRIDQMLSEGLVKEVQELLDSGCTPDMVSMQGLGYKEIIPYLNGECSLDEAIYILKRDTRHFAKRQLTWFRRERDVIWVDKDALAATKEQLDFMLSCLNERNILV